MSRKDYELIARLVRTLPDLEELDWRDYRIQVAKHFAWAIREHDNRHFNVEKFLAACQPQTQTQKGTSK